MSETMARGAIRSGVDGPGGAHVAAGSPDQNIGIEHHSDFPIFAFVLAS
jgi:hypothetical protein